MTPVRRYLSMALSSVTVLLLGFVVAVAARSRPGTSPEDPLFEFNSRLDVDVGQVFAWIILVMAVIGAVLFALGLKQSKPRQDQKKRSYLGLILGVIAFFLIFRYAQPFAENLLNPEALEATGETTDQIPPGSSGSSAWLFSLLLAAIVAAALTRVGLAVRDGDPALEPEQASAYPLEERLTPSFGRSTWVGGTDPRSRIFQAYYGFEESAGERGVVRRATETANRHANRAVAELGLDPVGVSRLVGLYGRARFGLTNQNETTAGEAERLAGSVFEGVTA